MPGRLKRDKMVEEHKEESGELKTERRERRSSIEEVEAEEEKKKRRREAVG